MTKSKILEILEFLQREGLLTNSRTNQLVYDRYKNGGNTDEVISFILTSGEVRGEMECSRCRKMLPAGQFRFYQTRVSSTGYLMRSNALCRDCTEASDKKRREVLSQEKDRIPPRPQKGAVCPNCNRAWPGNWHRHHSEKTNRFIGWLCGNCNMAMQDQRNPNAKNEK